MSFDSVPDRFRKLPKLTPEVRKQLSRDKKCWNCHEAGHRSFDPECPALPYADAINEWRKKDDASTRLRMATLDDDSDSDYEDQIPADDLPDEDIDGENLINLNPKENSGND